MPPATVPRSSEASSDNDELPDLDVLIHRARPKTNSPKKPINSKKSSGQIPPKAPSVRRRKLSPLSDNVLLRPWSEDPMAPTHHVKAPPTAGGNKSISRPKTKVRTEKLESAPRLISSRDGNREDESSNVVLAEVTFDGGSSVDDSSEFHDTLSLDSDDSDGSDDLFDGRNLEYLDEPPGRRSKVRGQERSTSQRRHTSKEDRQQTTAIKTVHLIGLSQTGLVDDNLLGAIDRLCIDDLDFQPPAASRETKSCHRRPATPPPATPPKLRTGLVSPRKLSKIPTTPHHPSSDLFWSKDFVDDWNDEHSPKKQLFPDVSKRTSKSSSSPKKSMTNKAAADRDAKKEFEKRKHDLAQAFLEELDRVITQGRLSELAEKTGGIKLSWTNKLNTTAGRANWKRETIRTNNPVGSEASVKHRHHASIELAEKVIDNEHRLLNVIAHEFCHLANFMISGVTTNPHGKEFKNWAAKCSRMFGDRGIEVTTKHSYEIDFKYVWECTSCAMEYKRHSKSINPDRHRCGSCKSLLKQTRPVPRTSTAKPSEYQKFMREQMKLLKEKWPKSPQKEIMKLAADRWSSLQASAKGGAGTGKMKVSVDEVAAGIGALAIDGAE